MPADLRPQGQTRVVNLTIRRLALEVAVEGSRVAAVLDKPWAHDAALAPTEDRLIALATMALELRSELIKERKKEEADRG